MASRTSWGDGPASIGALESLFRSRVEPHFGQAGNKPFAAGHVEHVTTFTSAEQLQGQDLRHGKLSGREANVTATEIQSQLRGPA